MARLEYSSDLSPVPVGKVVTAQKPPAQTGRLLPGCKRKPNGSLALAVYGRSAVAFSRLGSGIARDSERAGRLLAHDCAEDVATRGCLAGILNLSMCPNNFN